jgi:hypothetical protein
VSKQRREDVFQARRNGKIFQRADSNGNNCYILALIISNYYIGVSTDTGMATVMNRASLRSSQNSSQHSSQNED